MENVGDAGRGRRSVADRVCPPTKETDFNHSKRPFPVTQSHFLSGSHSLSPFSFSPSFIKIYFYKLPLRSTILSYTRDKLSSSHLTSSYFYTISIQSGSRVKLPKQCHTTARSRQGNALTMLLHYLTIPRPFDSSILYRHPSGLSLKSCQLSNGITSTSPPFS